MPLIDSLRIASSFAWSDTKARYRRSVLGPLWIVLGTAVGVAGLGYLWSGLMGADRSVFVPSLTVGLVIWQLIAGSVSESSNVFVRGGQVIRNMRIHLLFFPLQMVCRQLITFAHNLIVILVIFLIYPPHVGWQQLLVLPGLVILIGNLLWIALLLGMLGARFRDLDYLIGAVLPMFFFISPILFRPDHATVSPLIVWSNPFSYLITVVRAPLEGRVPEPFVYAGAIILLLAGWASAIWFYNKRGSRIAFWI